MHEGTPKVHSKMIEMECAHFLSESTAESRRAIAFRDFCRRFDVGIEIFPIGSSQLKVSAEYQRWSTVSLLFCQTTPLTISWGQSACSEDLLLFRVAAGDYRVMCEGASERFGANTAVLLRGSAGAKLIIDQPALFTLTSVPRELLPQAARNLDHQPICQIEATNPALRLLFAYQDFLRGREASSDPFLTLKVGQHLADLMAVALSSPASEQAFTLRATRLDAIKSDILANLAQVRLSAKTVARRQGVTDRYIHKLFETTGETFGRYVMEERLKRAYKLLVEPPFTVPIGTIALDVGFGELSTFNRAFKRRFGDTPTGVRRKYSSKSTLGIDPSLCAGHRGLTPFFFANLNADNVT
jgi:AraC-like DNA-binding protein